ncbi:MAG: M23 family metallopeptidase [Clostridia bacterium]|nr:M23 family metallopeptidase [Clostridia bacterium]
MRLPYKSGVVRVTSPYGKRVLFGAEEFHKGIDLVGSDKTLVAPCDGVVGWAGVYDDSASGGRTWEWGGYVRIETDDGYAVYLCHMATVAVSRGQRVSAGDVIGTEGSTGRSTGSHCHFEVRKGGKSTDPAVFLGIANRVGSYPVEKVNENVDVVPDYAALVCGKCGFEQQTREYLDGYRFSADLWRKLWLAME